MLLTINNRKEISKKIEKGEPIKLSFKSIGERFLMILNGILAKLLSKKDQPFLLNSLITILREIVINAIKANSKRVFFIKNGLDINNQDQYKKGMDRFKKEVIGDFYSIESDLDRSDYYVELNFELVKNKLIIEIINNSPILPVELERINFRIKKAIQYNDFSDAYQEIEDDTEGAGLGIVIAVLLLKNMGIDPENYLIESDGKITRTTLTVPQELRPAEITTRVKEQIISEIEGIPTFPENILQLQRLCNDPESSITKIVKRIEIDPALTTDVIKLSNSAGIAAGVQINDIKTAVVTIGMKNLNVILTASNARRILNERFSSFEQIWEHCNKVAFYARNIAISYRLNSIIENSYMGGLLHDLGKIILMATDKKLVNSIADIVENRKITTTTLEEISIGISHSTIGSQISESWNFPVFLIEAIKFHHAPLSCSDKHKDLVYTVYLANMLSGIEARKYTYYYIEEAVLERFDLLDSDKFNSFHEKLKNRFKSSVMI